MDSNLTPEEAAKRVTGSYIVRMAGCASCLDTRLALCANDQGYRTNHLVARRALVATERALRGIQNTKIAVWSKGGDFDAIVEYEGMPPMTCLECLDLALEFLGTAEEQLSEYLSSPTAVIDDISMLEPLHEWVRYCLWDLGQLRDSPKPAVRRIS